jgi:hypothetical protein
MRARRAGATLVDLALAAAIAVFPAHLFAVIWSANPFPPGRFPDSPVTGPSVAIRLGMLVGATLVVFAILRARLERGGQGPGKALFSLRVEDWKVVEDGESLDLVERLGVVAGRFARPLLLGLTSVLLAVLWGGAVERSIVESREFELLHHAYAYDAEYGCCSGEKMRECPRMLRIWAAVADHSDGKGQIPPREHLLERCPSARQYTRP